MAYTEAQLAALLPVPAPDANKYTRGVLTLVAGAPVYPGAACLAAAAAQRMGAGYVQVATAPENVRVVQAFRPSLVARSWEGLMGESLRAAESPEAAEASVDAESSLLIKPSTLEKPCAYVVGPGFAPDDDRTARLALFVLEHAEAPVLVDGGALAAVGAQEGRAVLRERAERGLATVLTPHGGEAARLAKPLDLAVPSADNPSELAEYAAALSQAYAATVVLKGPDTYITQGNQVAVMGEGTPALAKAGTGDVLAGMISALLAQGTAPFDAAMLGATLHARAARAAEAELTAICVTPEDIISSIPHAVRTLLPERS